MSKITTRDIAEEGNTPQVGVKNKKRKLMKVSRPEAKVAMTSVNKKFNSLELLVQRRTARVKRKIDFKSFAERGVKNATNENNNAQICVENELRRGRHQNIEEN